MNVTNYGEGQWAVQPFLPNSHGICGQKGAKTMVEREEKTSACAVWYAFENPH
jgi:hypothetical protein